MIIISIKKAKKNFLLQNQKNLANKKQKKI